MWRQTDERRVWYEWCVDVYAFGADEKGKQKKRVKVGGSELHSSIKEACLM
jgi:type II protein arginine methyltransferase